MQLLEHGEIILRRFALSDREKLAELANNKKIWDNVRDYFPHPYSLKNAEDFIAYSQKKNPLHVFAIQYQNKLAGAIELVKQTDIYRHSAEIGYWIGEPFWNKGIGTQAVKLIVDYGFEELKLVRIYAGIIDYNKASQKILEKAGFTFECVFEKSIFKNGKLCNEHRYGIIQKSNLDLLS